MRIRRFGQLGLLMTVLMLLGIQGGGAQEIGGYAFQRIWQRTDQPVAAGRVDRGWVFGPTPFTGTMLEPYVEGKSPSGTGTRQVQYFDKARLEIRDSTGDPSAPGYATTGLLARELVTGRMQLGDSSYVDYGPAEINVAGDADDPIGPTYASFHAAVTYQAIPAGWRVTQTIDRSGHVGDDAGLAGYGVSAAVYVPETKHNIASVFWTFMTSSGTVYDGVQYSNGRLFSDPYAVTGYPLTEAYWASVKVGGVSKQVLVQAFERRVLTYTPDNPEGWKVESGNIGRHYYQWRYEGANSDVLTTRNVSSRKDLDGNWVFLGEISNNSRAAQENVKITVTLFDRSNAVVATKSSYLDFSVIAPGERLPFRVWFDSGAAFDHQEVKVTGAVSARTDRAPLHATAVTARAMTDHSYQISGTVRNEGNDAVARPVYVVVLYDGAGRVIDFSAGFLTRSTLAAGQTTGFDATFYNAPADFSHFTAFFSD